MSSLIPASQKLAMGNVFFDIHDTFAREICMFKQAELVTIATNPNFNPFFNAPAVNDTVNTIFQSGVFTARIKYNAEQDLKYMLGGGNDQVVLTNQDGVVRIKLDATGAAYLNDALNARFDGEIFEIISDKRPHGLFKTDFYTFFLRKVN